MTDSGNTLHRPGDRASARRANAIERIWRLLTSPSAAFLILFPTIGYYSLATYSNFLSGDEGSIGGILIRAGALGVLLIAYFGTPYKNRRGLSIYLLPATLFIAIYSLRMAENILFLGIHLPQGNLKILIEFFLSSLMAAYILAFSQRGIRDEDIIPLLSLLAIFFLAGMALNWEALAETASHRMSLTRINPISMAYTASSFLLFYMLAFTRSRRLLAEAFMLVPFLLLIVSLARSRGMMIATAVTVFVYVLSLRGRKRLQALCGLALVVTAMAIFAGDYVGYAIEAIQRIDTQADQSTAIRMSLFRGAWDQFLANPLFGRYLNEQMSGYYPHNIYLESLMAVGIVGTLPFVTHLALALRAAFGLLRRECASFAEVFVALLFIREAIGATASGALWSVAGFWITSFLVIVMWYGRTDDKASLRHPASIRAAPPPKDGWAHYQKEQLKVVVVQPGIPAYRLGFFNRLADQLGDRFSVYASPGGLGILTARSTQYSWERALGSLRQLAPGLEWQSGALSIPFSRGDVVVVSGAPRCLSNIALLLKARWRGAKTIWWGHYWSSTSRPWRASLRMVLLRLADAVLFYTDQEVEEYLGKQQNAKPVKALNNGIETNEIVRLRKAYDTASRPRDLLVIGRLTKKAQIGLLLDVLASPTCAGVKLDVVGAGEEEQALREHAVRLAISDRITWHGGTTNEQQIANVANMCKLFVYPGSVGLSLIHCFAYGLPAIVHDYRWRHGPEIAALRAGKNGMCFREGDALSLAQAIALLLTDKTALSRMSNAAIRTTEDTFNAENMADRFLELIKIISHDPFRQQNPTHR